MINISLFLFLKQIKITQSNPVLISTFFTVKTTQIMSFFTENILENILELLYLVYFCFKTLIRILSIMFFLTLHCETSQ